MTSGDAAPTESRLVALAAGGDRAAFAALVQAHQGYLRKLLGRVCRGDQGRADDLAQEAFLRAWRALPGFRGEARFRTYDGREFDGLFTCCYPREYLPQGATLVGVIDITDRLRAQEDLAVRIEERTRTMLEAGLLDEVRGLLRRGNTREPDQIRIADLEIDLLRRRVTRGGARIDPDPSAERKRPLGSCRGRTAARRADPPEGRARG